MGGFGQRSQNTGGVFFGWQESGSTLQIQFGEACDYFTARHGVDTAFETHLDISEFDKLMSCLVKEMRAASDATVPVDEDGLHNQASITPMAEENLNARDH